MLDHDDVESAVVRIRTRELEVEKSAKDGGIDDREVDQAQPLGSSFGLDFATEDRPLLHRNRHRHGVGQPPESRPQVGPRREAGELYVDARRGRMDEMPRRLTVARELARVVAREPAAGEESHGFLHVHGNVDRTGEVVRGAEGQYAEDGRCRDDRVRDRADRSITAGRDYDGWR